MKKLSVPILEVSNLIKNTKKANIERLTLNVPKGDTVAVLHKNENNISLLTEILSGKTKPEKGKIFFKGDDVTGVKNAFGIVYDSPVLSKNRTVSECASAPIVKRGLARSMAVVLVQKEAKAFGLEEYINEKIGSLPHNIAARAELFTAYMCSHELIAINEPFSTLDEEERKAETKRLLDLKNSSKLSLLVFTKNIETALLFGDYIMVVNEKTESSGIIASEKGKKEKTQQKVKELYDSV